MQFGIFITHRIYWRWDRQRKNSSNNPISLLRRIAKVKCANSYTDYDVLESLDEPHSEKTLHIEVFFDFVITVIDTQTVSIRTFVKQLGSEPNEDSEMVSKNNSENYNNMTKKLTEVLEFNKINIFVQFFRVLIRF